MLRLIKGNAEKSVLFEDLARGSLSGAVCWIEYGQCLNNTLLGPQIDSCRLDRSQNTYSDLECLYYELKNNFEELFDTVRYSDIYLYGNFSEQEIDVLFKISEWMNSSESNRIRTRLNVTIQSDNNDLIVSIIR